MPAATLDPRFLQPEIWQWRENFAVREGQFIRFGWAMPEKPRAIVCILPGLSEYGEKYFETAHTLLARGFAVAVIDWRGQGLSWRGVDRNKRVHVDFSDDVSDARAFLEALPNTDCPRVILGHSMGGHIALRLIHDNPDACVCAVLSAPMLGLPLPERLVRLLTKFMRMIGRDLAYLPGYGAWSYKRMTRGLNALTSDPARRKMQEYWMRHCPELRMGGLTASWLAAAFASMRRVRDDNYLKTIATPLLVALAGHDRVVSNKAIENAVADMPQATLARIPGSLHEVMMEADIHRDAFWSAFDSFVAKHLPQA